MEEKRTSTFSNGLIWFGAGVSIAEIITGTYLASLGFKKGLAAILLGHLIGGILMFGAGLIGGKERKSSMETVKMSFGEKGSLLFSILNILQLVGWTAIMIYDGSMAANGIVHAGAWVWALVIGVLILVWILIGITNLGKINSIAMGALFILTLILCKVIFFDDGIAVGTVAESMSFGAAVELAVAMPLSWLPLISDYTRNAKKPVQATGASVIVYSVVSCFMYVIGMGAAIYTGEGDIAQILLKAGLGIAGLMIVVFSTVTTTFLDAYSAGVSCVSIYKKISEKWSAVVVTVIGTIAAIVYPMDNITDFLYLIGSVFAPMIAIQLADYFLLKRIVRQAADIRNLCIWMAGFIIYRLFMRVDTPVGNTLPVMLITIALCLVVACVVRGIKTTKAEVTLYDENK
ncbi:MAG: putative hydroxymethylpyrimidine transporter CytX [Lachnospiraceae bacterium]|nr:putative hydroxymethylpyrimidine transporter CytX [Lachnospiraceae bacterium]